MKMKQISHIITFALFALASSIADAQTYPAKLVRIMVPYPAGGGVDWIVRNISSRLGENLRQQILVENRPGATGNIGTEFVARAVPDGYTLLAAYSSFASNAAVYTSLPFDPIKDFAPITLLCITPGILVVNVSMPVKTVKEIIALAKRRPGEIVYASNPGPGSPGHLAMELFNMMASIKMTHVPYKGGPQTAVALINGEAQIAIPTVDVILPHVRSGKVRAIAIASPERFSLFPNIPTINESGLRGYEMNAWYAFFAPAKTPQSIIAQLNREVIKILQRPDLQESFLQQGLEIRSSTPEQLGALLRDEIEKWTKVAKATGAKID
jgi:tripartite-type tricarboxylate transporter receptor subunit TctC